VTNPYLEIGGGEGEVLLALPAFLPCTIFSFLTQNTGGGLGLLSPFPKSANAYNIAKEKKRKEKKRKGKERKEKKKKRKKRKGSNY